MVLPFWYQLTQVVLGKKLLNGCSSSSTSNSSSSSRSCTCVCCKLVLFSVNEYYAFVVIG